MCGCVCGLARRCWCSMGGRSLLLAWGLQSVFAQSVEEEDVRLIIAYVYHTISTSKSVVLLAFNTDISDLLITLPLHSPVHLPRHRRVCPPSHTPSQSPLHQSTVYTLCTNCHHHRQVCSPIDLPLITRPSLIEMTTGTLRPCIHGPGLTSLI